MLSSRGSMSLSQCFAELVKTRPQSLKKILLASDLEKVWRAMCVVLRSQLLLGHSVTLFSKVCGLYFTTKHVVSDGSIKYFARFPKFGFHQNFMLTYSLDSGIQERLDGSAQHDLHKLPLDLVAEEAKMSCEVVTAILHEFWLFIGEALYRGQLLNLEFPGVFTLLVKREKLNVKFDDHFRKDVFTIDSRKWPMSVRDTAYAVVMPADPTQRPASRQSRASSSRPVSKQQHAHHVDPRGYTAQYDDPENNSPVDEIQRPPFISAAQKDRLFTEMNRIPTPGSSKPPLSARSGTAEYHNRPVSSRQGAATRYNPNNAKRSQLPPPPQLEEESIYSVLTPQRQRDRDVMLQNTNVFPDSYEDNVRYNQYYTDNVVDEEDNIYANNYQQPSANTTNSRPGSRRKDQWQEKRAPVRGPYATDQDEEDMAERTLAEYYQAERQRQYNQKPHTYFDYRQPQSQAIQSYYGEGNQATSGGQEEENIYQSLPGNQGRNMVRPASSGGRPVSRLQRPTSPKGRSKPTPLNTQAFNPYDAEEDQEDDRHYFQFDAKTRKFQETGHVPLDQLHHHHEDHHTESVAQRRGRISPQKQRPTSQRSQKGFFDHFSQQEDDLTAADIRRKQTSTSTAGGSFFLGGSEPYGLGVKQQGRKRFESHQPVKGQDIRGLLQNSNVKHLPNSPTYHHPLSHHNKVLRTAPTRFGADDLYDTM